MKFRNVSIFKPRRRNKRHHPWLIAVTTNGARSVTSGSTDYADTCVIAERLSRIAQRVEGNISNAGELRQELERRKPLSHHLNAYERHLKASGKTGKHALQMRLYAEEAIEQFATVDDIVASDVQARVWKMDVSAVTKNRRLYAVTRFLKWGASDNRWPDEIVKRIKLARLPQTKTRPRRVITIEELVRLIHVTENGTDVAGVSGKQRALMYRTMVLTGLRFGELTRLQMRHLGGKCFEIPPDKTKNRKAAIIALPVDIWEEIIVFTSHTTSGDAPIFPVQKFNPDRLLKHDLKAAGIPRKTDRGVFDFQSMRHMTATLLAATGAQPKVVQAHMRHGSIQLTLDTYGHLFDKDRLRAAEVMGQIVQRRAQRTGANMHEQNPIPKWSDGESNPDLLNAIQDADSLVTIKLNELRNKRNRRIAPRAAQRLLRRVFTRAMRRGMR